MLIHVSVDLGELFRLGKKYPWVRPVHCPKCCGIRLWSHGFVTRYFDDFEHAVWIKRYRCPDCSSVHTLRPSGYRGFTQASNAVVLLSLLIKIIFGCYPSGICTRRQRYWFNRFKQEICCQKNVDFTDQSLMLKCLRSQFSIEDFSTSILLIYSWTYNVFKSLHLPFQATESGPSP